MWQFIKEIFYPVGGIVAVTGLILFIGLFSQYEYAVNIGEANLIKVTMGDKIIYEGKQAFINETSGGMTTTVTIYKSIFPFNVVKSKYSSNDIKIVPL